MCQESLNSTQEAFSTVIYTIGHSNHEADKFIQILNNYSIGTLVDVRSAPYSKYHSQFNKETIETILTNAGIKYIFMGRELGARPKGQDLYVNGKVSFERLAASEPFKQGISKLLNEAQKSNTVVMCSEREPVECHRAILISRSLGEKGVMVKHIISETEILDHSSIEETLLKKFKMQETLFDTEASKKTNLEKAYKKQEEKISYCKDPQEILA